MRYNVKTKRSLITLTWIVIGWFMSITVANAHFEAGEDNMWEGWGAGHMTFGIMPMALFWLGLIIVVVLLIRWSTKESFNNPSGQEKSALDILKKRFARGEIDKQEFEEAKHILTD
jgi:putative membrane protein